MTKAKVLDVAQGLSLLCRSFRLSKYREENRGKDRDDRDNHEQFDKRKGLSHNYNTFFGESSRREHSASLTTSIPL
jgi:hypothetical protein